LWHRGGVYLDTDIILLRPLDALVNAVAEERFPDTNHHSLSNAFMSFEPRHPFLWACMEEFASHFQPFGGNRSFGKLLELGLWGENGPKMIDRVLQRYREGTRPRMEGLRSGDGRGPSEKSPEVLVLPSSTFFHVPPNAILRHYAGSSKDGGLATELRQAGAYGVHLWNQVTRGSQPEPGSAVSALLLGGTATTTGGTARKSHAGIEL